MSSPKRKRIFYVENDVNNRVIATIILEQARATDSTQSSLGHWQRH